MLWTILCTQLCGNCLGMTSSCFNTTVHQCKKQGPWKHRWASLALKSVTCLHSPDCNPIEHIWNELEWRLQAPKLVSDLIHDIWQNGRKEKKRKWNTLLNLMKGLPRRGCYSCKRWADTILNPKNGMSLRFIWVYRQMWKYFQQHRVYRYRFNKKWSGYL